MAVQVGVGLFTGQVPAGSDRTFEQEYREILDLVRLAETLGFDSAWTSEHHGSGDGYLPSLLVMLGAFAAATDRIRLGTGVILTPFHDPLRLAEDAAVVDQLSGGRLILGLGLGWREEEFRMFGQPMSERVRRTTEAVEILRRAWTGQRFSFDGRIHSYDRVKLTPPPAQEGGVPIFLGGSTEAAVRRAGRISDGYIRTRSSLEDSRHALAWAEAGAMEAGKDPADLGFAQLQSAFVWDDTEGAWKRSIEGARHHLGVYTAWAEGDDTPERDTLQPRAPEDDAIRHIVFTGTTEEVARRMRPLVEAFGVRREFHLIVRLHYPGMPFDVAARAMELFAEGVLPVLKGA
jgi:probable F420-dependent oxidoreductase